MSEEESGDGLRAGAAGVAEEAGVVEEEGVTEEAEVVDDSAWEPGFKRVDRRSGELFAVAQLFRLAIVEWAPFTSVDISAY